jgi:hypothetical protein
LLIKTDSHLIQNAKSLVPVITGEYFNYLSFKINMKKAILVFLISTVVTACSFGQRRDGQVDASKIPVPVRHYQSEYTYDIPSDPGAWAKLKPELYGAFGSTGELYIRCEIPRVGKDALAWNQTGWRGERLNAQVLVWSADSVEQVRFLASDLVNTGGRTISRENIKIHLVRYVVSDFPYGATDFNCDTQKDSAWLMPDRFESFERFDLPGKTVRPVWISFEIPSECEPGMYSGTIDILSLKDKITLRVNIQVQKQVLPVPRDWKFRLDLWQNPWVLAEYYKVEPWSAEHKALLKKHLKLYADAGGKYITTYAVYSPWSDNSYRLEGTMIGWTRVINGSWKFDYSVFDQYVELAMEASIDKAITIYTPIPWGNRFRYLDEKSGNFVYEEWSPTSLEYRTFWNLFLDDLKAHLVKKGWFGKTYLGINENQLEYTLAAARLIKEHSKEWKITYAGDWHPELSSLLDDYSTVIKSEPRPEDIRARSSKGNTTTFYVCCTPPRPNNFVFSHPVEGRYLSWHAAAMGYNGFLRWAYDAWPADPVRDARHTLWPAGDCFLVYPGGNSCIRFEKLREGIVDYEKILILREQASKSTNPKVKNQMIALESHLARILVLHEDSKQEYNVEKMTDAVRQGTRMIIDLSNELGQY